MKEQQGFSDYRNRPPVSAQDDKAEPQARDSASQGIPGAPSAPSTERVTRAPKPTQHSARDGADAPPHKNAIWKVLAALGAGCLTIQVILLLVAMAGISAVTASCASSCSDSPIGDSREAAAFIASRDATSRDLSTFDALRGCFESLHGRLAAHDQAGLGGTERLLSVDELRSQIALGEWPSDDGGALSPRVWVRIAELSQDYLEEKTGEQWEVVDFAYAFPNNGPIPIPPTRDENSHTSTLLLCTRGADEGTFAYVMYYRWRSPALFEDDLASQRENRDQNLAMLDAIEQSGLLGSRDYLISNSDLLVWDQGTDDSLRDQELFLQTALELAPILGNYSDVVLLVGDTPINVSYDPLSSEYPNEKPLESMSFAEARSRLAMGRYNYSFSYAAGDALLRVDVGTEEQRPSLQDLRGLLATTVYDEYRHPWRAPDAGCSFDGELVEVVATQLGVPSEDVIAASFFDTSDSWVDSFDAWIVVPRGALPETPDAFCTCMDDLRDVLWARLLRDPERRLSMYVHVYMIDENTLVDADGAGVGFAELRERAAEDPTLLGNYSFDLLLSYMISETQWEDDAEPSAVDCTPRDVGGSIARSRAWVYGDTTSEP